MKKIIRLFLAVSVMLSMAVSVMAAPPSPGKDVRPEGGEIILSDGTVIHVDNPEEMSQYVQITESETEPETMEGYHNLAVVNVTLDGNVDSVNVVLYVPGVKKGDTIMVRMLVDGQWMNVEAVVIDDNKVQVRLTQSGTLEILKEGTETGSGTGSGTGSDSDTGAGTGDSQSGENTSSTSPKTGESNGFPIACAAIAAFGFVAIFAGYKAKTAQR